MSVTEPGRQRAGELGPDPLEAVAFVVPERRSHPAPEDCSQLGLARERHAVVDAVHVAVRERQEVADLAVGVVDDGIEDGHPPEARIIADDELDPVDRIVGMDPLLDHALAERSVPQDRRWHDRPTHGLGDEERRDFPAGERADREVEERSLCDRGLVDGMERLRQVRMVNQHDERLVGGSGQAAEDLERAVAEGRQGSLRRPTAARAPAAPAGAGVGADDRPLRGGCGRGRLVS